MNKKPIRLGVIGCGIAAHNLHWPAIKVQRERFEITAVCNHTRPKAESLAAEVGGAEIFTDYHELLSSDVVEAVLIALPIALNRQVAGDCLAAGVHVICEKPLAHDLPSARELAVLAGKSERVFMVGENYYYRDDFADAVAAISAGHIGKIFLIQFSGTASIDHTRSYGATRWRQTPAHRGGFVSDAGVHHAASLRLFAGEVKRLQAFALNIHPVIRAEDNLVASSLFTSGALGSYSVTYTAVDTEHHTSIKIFGTAGTIEIGHGDLRVSGKHAFAKKYADFDNGMRNQWRGFYDAVRHGKSFPSTARACLADQELVWAMLDSAETGTPIDCPPK